MTTLNPSEATSLALHTLTSQIRNILLMPDGPAKAAIGGFETLLTANLTMISEVANAHIDEFNTLIGELEGRDGELLTQAALVSELRQQVAEAEQRIVAARQESAAELEAKAGYLLGGEGRYQLLRRLPTGKRARVYVLTDLVLA
ncbi:hypothetical protein, partial [Aeromonas caviae]|uniref:hypothetical protein n=1 Tax=Aeromonas caviae TaxID=648 RepID=UPI001CC48553